MHTTDRNECNWVMGNTERMSGDKIGSYPENPTSGVNDLTVLTRYQTGPADAAVLFCVILLRVKRLQKTYVCSHDHNE
jgi:hypothetical protein